MKKLALLAGVGLLAFGAMDTAEAQRWNRDGGFRNGGNWQQSGNWNRGDWNRGNWNRGYNYGYRRSSGGAVAAGLVGGAILGGLFSAAAAPAYAYPYGYGYTYPAPSYGYGYAQPVATYYDDDYYAAPAYQTRVVYQQPRVVYQQPRVTTRVVYRDAPNVRRTRVVYRQAPTVRQRNVYRQSQAGFSFGQPAYDTRVSVRQNRTTRVAHDNFRRDVISTGSVAERREMRQERKMQRRMMRD